MGYRQLTQDERYVIARMSAQGCSTRAIGLALDRSAATISRERARNATARDGWYRADKAQQYAMARRRRSRKKDQYSQQEWTAVARLLELKWSPQQIVGRRELLRQPCMSKETIYRRLRRDRRGGGQLWRCLRILSKFGRKHRGSPATRGRLIGKRHISQLPAAVQRRRQIGHWEGDTVMGADQRHCVLTLVERVTGYVMLSKLVARTQGAGRRSLEGSHCACTRAGAHHHAGADLAGAAVRPPRSVLAAIPARARPTTGVPERIDALDRHARASASSRGRAQSDRSGPASACSSSHCRKAARIGRSADARVVQK